MAFFTRCMTAPRLIPPPLPHLLADSSADHSDFITFQIPAVPSSILSIGRFPLLGNFHECKQVGASIKQRQKLNLARSLLTSNNFDGYARISIHPVCIDWGSEILLTWVRP